MKNVNPRPVDFDNSIELIFYKWYNLSNKLLYERRKPND